MSVAAGWQLRRCILGSIPERLYDEPVERKFIFIPPSHIKALDPARSLVVGGRGTGKTFWWETLASDVGANVLLPRLFDARKEGLRYEVSVGYGSKSLAILDRPLDADTLNDLFEHFPERAVWKAVVLARVAPSRIEALNGWSDVARWVHENPASYAQIIAETDAGLTQEKRRHLVVFDAIDRTGMLWRDIVRAHRALFSVLLDLSGLRAIRAKAFVRLDVLDDPEVLRFPDASKLQTSAVDLAWTRADLYGLLWQYLGNSNEHAEAFRALSDGFRQHGGIWPVPSELGSSEDVQQRLWHQLAGPWMGANERRGDTYAWLPNHLADAFGRVSPRSFLAAVRAAALATPTDEARALHYRAIQDGVREAAEIRAREIREDFPWSQRALEALGGMMVPCDPHDVLEAWERARLDELVDRDPDARRRRRHGSDLPGVIDDLADLGLMQRLRDGRINVPDVYRLRFGIKRKGGVGVAPRRA